MTMYRYKVRAAVAAALLVLTAASSHAAPTNRGPVDVIEIAQANDQQPRELEPRYQPVPPKEKSWYNDEYIFAATKGVAHSTMAPAAKMTLYPLSVLFDIVLLPFATIGGFFG